MQGEQMAGDTNLSKQRAWQLQHTLEIIQKKIDAGKPIRPRLVAQLEQDRAQARNLGLDVAASDLFTRHSKVKPGKTHVLVPHPDASDQSQGPNKGGLDAVVDPLTDGLPTPGEAGGIGFMGLAVAAVLIIVLFGGKK